MKNPIRRSETKKKGFTLIELLVVIIVIATLAAIAVPQYFRSVERSRALEMLNTANTLREAFDRFYVRNGTTTANLSCLDIEIGDGNVTVTGAGTDPCAYVAGINSMITLRSGATIQAVGSSASATNIFITRPLGDGTNYGFYFQSSSAATATTPVISCIAVSGSKATALCTSFGGVKGSTVTMPDATKPYRFALNQ